MGLVPRGRSSVLAFATMALLSAALSVGLFATHEVGFAGLLLGLSVSGVAASLTHRASRRRVLRLGGRDVAMAIVPWGVVVSEDSERRVLRWPAVRAVHVDQEHVIRGGTPAIVGSVVTVETDRERLVGRAPGAAGLERLVAGLALYAEEAARPVAADLAGEEPLEDAITEPVVALLLRRAREVASSSRGAFELELPTAGYRDVARPTATPATVARLRALLEEDLEHAADPRPLAALLAAVLGARELVPELLRLTASPHPLVAASAKAAALRLGAPPNRAGSLEELSAFLFEDDHAILAEWALPEPIAQNCGA